MMDKNKINSISFLKKIVLKFLLLLFIILLLSNNRILGQNINLTTNNIGFTQIGIGSDNQYIYRLDVNVTGSIAFLDNIFFNTGGSYTAADLQGLTFQLWYNTQPDFYNATQIGSIQPSIGPGGTIVFSGLSLPMNIGNHYLWLSVDTSPSSISGNTIFAKILSPADVMFSSGTVSGFLVDGLVQTFTNSPGLALYTYSIPGSNIAPGSSNVAIFQFQIQNSYPAYVASNLMDMALDFAGTFTNADISAVKLWTSTANNFSTATLRSTFNFINPGINQIDAGNTQVSAGSLLYCWITIDVRSSATNGNTIKIQNVDYPDFIFRFANIVTGSLFDGNTYTISSAPSIQVNSIPTGVANLTTGTLDNILYQLSISCTNNPTILDVLQFTTGGTYQISDLVTNSFKLYHNSSNNFSTASLVSSAAIISSGGGIAFSSLSQTIAVGTTNYYWLTADVQNTATNGKNIYILNQGVSDFTFQSGVLTLNSTLGDTKTIVNNIPYITINSIGVGATNILSSSTNNLLYEISITTTINSSVLLNDIKFVSGGTYQTTDLAPNSFKLWYGGTTNNFSLSTNVANSSIVNSGGNIAFNSLSQTILANVTVYYWLSVDISSVANNGNTIFVQPMDSLNFNFQLGQVTVNASMGDTQTIQSSLPLFNINSLSPSASNINVGSSNNILYQISVGSNSNPATLNSIQFTTGGTYLGTDIVTNSFRLWYNTSNSFSTASSVGSQGVVSSGGVLSYTGLNQTILSNSTIYYWLTADIASSATLGNTIHIMASTSSNITFSSGSMIINTTDGGVQTISSPIPLITVSTLGNAPANINTGSSNNILYQLSIKSSNNPSTLNSIQFTTVGTYQSTDIVANSFKLWYSASNSFSTASNVGVRSVVSSGGVLSYTGLGQAIASGSTVYYWLTADISPTAVNGNTIQILAPSSSDISFSLGTITLGTSNGGLQTITSLLPLITVSTLGNAAANVNTGTSNNILYQLSINSSINPSTLSSIQFSTAGTYQSTDIVASSFKLWYNTSNSFSTASNVGVRSVVSSGGVLSYTGLGQAIASGSTVYYWLTADISPTAVNGNTIQILAPSSSDISFSLGTITLGTSNGGLQTITSLLPLITVSTLGNAAANVNTGTSNNILYQLSINSSINPSTLSSIQFSTAGTYQSTDIVASSFKLWYNTSNSFSTASNVGVRSVVSSGGVLSYTGLGQAIASGSTVYYWLTVDIPANATNGNTINIQATSSSDIAFSSGIPTMNTLNGGVKTILGNTAILVNSLGASVSNINAGSLNNILYQLSINCTANATTLNSIQFSTAGTYQGADLVNNSFKLWFASTNSLAGASNVGVLNIVNSGGILAFQNLNQTITAGSTFYYWLTVDVNGSATNGNTISIGQLQSVDMLFNSAATVTLNTSVGGIKTIIGIPAKLEDAILPNLFSPNGDGKNDRLILRTINISDISELRLDIFDKNGSRIFQCNDLAIATQDGWDGGSYLSGVYFYVLNIRFNNGISSQKKGTITLIR